MPEIRTGPPMDETQSAADTPGTVTVRYWASARAAAGRTEDTVAGVVTVQQALDAVRALRSDDARFDRVLAISSVLLGDRPVRREALSDERVAPGDVVEILPPFAGG